MIFQNEISPIALLNAKGEVLLEEGDVETDQDDINENAHLGSLERGDIAEREEREKRENISSNEFQNAYNFKKLIIGKKSFRFCNMKKEKNVNAKILLPLFRAALPTFNYGFMKIHVHLGKYFFSSSGEILEATKETLAKVKPPRQNSLRRSIVASYLPQCSHCSREPCQECSQCSHCSHCSQPLCSNCSRSLCSPDVNEDALQGEKHSIEKEYSEVHQEKSLSVVKRWKIFNLGEIWVKPWETRSSFFDKYNSQRGGDVVKRIFDDFKPMRMKHEGDVKIMNLMPSLDHLIKGLGKEEIDDFLNNNIRVGRDDSIHYTVQTNFSDKMSLIMAVGGIHTCPENGEDTLVTIYFQCSYDDFLYKDSSANQGSNITSLSSYSRITNFEEIATCHYRLSITSPFVCFHPMVTSSVLHHDRSTQCYVQH